jgi:type VI secretion system protein ImpK
MSNPKPISQSGTDVEEQAASGDNLALSYQGLLTGIVRIQAGRQNVTDADTFRKRTKAALEEVQRDAVKLGYENSDIRETHFAVVAFLDSVILNSSQPIRAEWERQTLQEELFGQSDAGVVFFEKLERLRSRRDSRHLGDVLEVYLLCLLLGFEGRFSGGLRGELYSITDRVRSRIEDIRGRSFRLSPAGLPEQSGVVQSFHFPTVMQYRWILLGAVIFTLLLFIIAKVDLIWTSDQIRSRLF